MLQKIQLLLIINAAFLAGILVTQTVQLVSAHGGDINKIHACVKNNSLFNSANVRIVGANDNCASNETAVDWSKLSYATGLEGVPFMCGGCLLDEQVNNNFVSKNLPNAYFAYSSINENVNFSNSNLTGAIFSDSNISANFYAANLTNTNFRRDELFNTNFTNANLTGARFDGENPGDGSSLNATNFTGANLTNANLKNVEIVDNPPILTDVIWSNTICPDGSNSNNNGNTCVGHFL